MKKAVLSVSLFLFAFAASSCRKKDFDTYTSIYGIVNDNSTTEPLSGAIVTLLQDGQNQTTGIDGCFTFNELEPQQYTIIVQKLGYQTNRKTVTAVVGEKTEANIPLTSSN